MARSYYNLDPSTLAQEQDAAHRVGVAAIELPSAEFDRLAAEGERMIYVLAGDRLLVSERHAMAEHISHAVLADGEPVQAAGEFEVIEFGDVKVVTSLNNMSGHYQPGRESLDVAMEAFEERGLRVLAGGVEQYDWHTP